MNKELLKRTTVKVAASDGITDITGSGVIAKCSKGKYYVITAEHCIAGKKDKRLQEVSVDRISISYKENNEEEFTDLTIDEIVHKDTDRDIAVISVHNMNGHIHPTTCCTFAQLPTNLSFNFRGYPKWLGSQDGKSCQAKTYDCSLEESDVTKFIIKSDELKDPTLMRGVEETSHGLSGSGVFLIKDEKLYLLGIVTDLREEKGTFGHISCRKLDSIIQSLEFDSFHFKAGLAELNKWVDIEENILKNKIQELQKSNIEDFNNLYRKCQILYEPLDVDEMVNALLTDYFTAEINISKLGIYNPILEESFEEAKNLLASKVKRTLNKRQVKTKDDAQDILQQVTDIFIDLFKKEAGEGILNSTLEKSSNKAVTGLLLNCDLDYKIV